MNIAAQNSDLTCKYSVRSTSDGWRVEQAEACLGVHADPAVAVEQACERARADADHGRLAIVTAETTPQEFHCYIPSIDPRPSPAALPPYLRLLVNL